MLLEVLVAFVILAGAVILNLRIFGEGIRGLEAARERSLMMDIARRELARLELVPTLKTGGLNGTGDGFAWSIEITQQAGKPSAAKGVVPFRVKVKVGKDSRPGAYPVAVETVLLAVPDE